MVQRSIARSFFTDHRNPISTFIHYVFLPHADRCNELGWLEREMAGKLEAAKTARLTLASLISIMQYVLAN